MNQAQLNYQLRSNIFRTGLRRAGFWIVLLASFATVGLQSRAALYYVDYVSGNDNNQGTNANTPWMHCPGDANSRGIAARTALSAGTTVKFKGGSVYNGLILLNWSGATNSPIIYDGNSAGDWGTGRAIFDRNYQPFTKGGGGSDGFGICFKGVARSSFLTFRGFEFRNIGGYADNDAILSTLCTTNPVKSVPDGYAFLFYDVSTGRNTNLRFENMYFHRIGQWRNTHPFSGTESVSGCGIYIRNPKFLVVTNCEFTQMKVAVGLYTTADGVNDNAVENVEIVNIDCHNYMNWPIDVAALADGASFNNIKIHDSKIHDYHEMEYGNWQGCGDPPHTDGIFLRNAGRSNTSWTNVSIFNCDFYADSIGNSKGGTASIFISEGPSVDIYNNVFWAVPETRVIGIDHGHYSPQPQTVRIMNNTFYGPQRPITMQGPPTPEQRRVYVWNNLMQCTNGIAFGGVLVASETGTRFTSLDWNLYYDPDWTVAQKYIVKFAPGYYMLATVRTDKDYEANGRYANPLMVNPGGGSFAVSDLRLRSGSPAIGAGTNLSAYFTTDKSGLTRGVSWDVGAYSSAAIPPPTNVRLVSNP